MKKQYIKQIRDTKDEVIDGVQNKWGNIYFEWSSNPSLVKACLQHEVQPAIFFEELLIESGYKKVDVIAHDESKGEAIKEF